MSALSKLPKNSQDWTRIAQQHSVVNSSIHDLADLNSGSQVETKQFLLLRAVWKGRRALEFKNDCRDHDWISRDVLKKATSYLGTLKSWTGYMESFGPNNKKISEGTFAMVQYYQRLSIQPRQKPSDEEINLSSPKVAFSPRVTRSQVARRNQGSTSRPETPSRPPKEDMSIDEHFGNLDLDSDTSSLNSDPLGSLSYHSPLSGEVGKQYQSIEDEQIVNTALILFLNALTLHCDYAQGAWTLYRKPFVVKTSTTKVYEARVDGLLRIKDRTCAIVEVKPFIRYGSEKTLDKIRMQETAQMAAWIAQDPPVLKSPSAKFRRLLVSQDHGEVYLIIATFDYQYVEYICALGTGSRGKGSTHSFLEMREYGPFEVKSPEQMEQLGIILLGASIQGGL